MTSSHQDTPPCQWFSRLAAALDRRPHPGSPGCSSAPSWPAAGGPSPAWIRAAGLSDQFQPCYTTVAAAGKKADDIAARLV